VYLQKILEEKPVGKIIMAMNGNFFSVSLSVMLLSRENEKVDAIEYNMVV
jgi:hypothetical protein